MPCIQSSPSSKLQLSTSVDPESVNEKTLPLFRAVRHVRAGIAFSFSFFFFKQYYELLLNFLRLNHSAVHLPVGS